jgi:hypothetical protein
LRHLPRDSETLRELQPSAAWSDETFMLANITDLIGDLFAKDYEHVKRPGEKEKFSTAQPVGKADHDALMARFGGGADG